MNDFNIEVGEPSELWPIGLVRWEAEGEHHVIAHVRKRDGMRGFGVFGGDSDPWFVPYEVLVEAHRTLESWAGEGKPIVSFEWVDDGKTLVLRCGVNRNGHSMGYLLVEGTELPVAAIPLEVIETALVTRNG